MKVATCLVVVALPLAIVLTACTGHEPPGQTQSGIIEGSICWMPDQLPNWECCVDHPEACQSCVGDPLVCGPDTFCGEQPTPEQRDACCMTPGNEWQCLVISGRMASCKCNCDNVTDNVCPNPPAPAPKTCIGKGVGGHCTPTSATDCTGTCNCRCVTVDGKACTSSKSPSYDGVGTCVGSFPP